MKKETEIILINISGADRPGVTTALMHILAEHNARILDIGQANIHHTLSLGIMFESQAIHSGEIMKKLLFKSSELGVFIRFKPIETDQYEEWVNLQGKHKFIVTILGRKLSAEQIAAVTDVVVKHHLNIEKIVRLSGRTSLQKQDIPAGSCIELTVRGANLNVEMMRREFLALSMRLKIDVALQEDNIYRRMRRLICFDMDSTLIQTEVIDELADRAGVGDQVRTITEATMRGEIDFKESFTRRVALLKGLDESVMKDIAEKLPITEGMERLIKVLKKSGYKIAILSGGFTYFGNYLKEKYAIDYVYANQLEIENGRLTGRHLGDIVDGKRKAELLQLIAQIENVDIRQTVAVGDGANDLPMLEMAGLGIAFHAKPKVKQTARQSLSTIGLDGILYFLGYKDSMLISEWGEQV